MKKEFGTQNHTEEELEQAEESGQHISGEPDPDLAAVGGGGIAGAAAGATIGTAAGGPLAGALGAAVGAIIGGAAGDAISDKIDPKIEEAYWEENFRKRPYYKTGDRYEDYLPAYRFGWESANHNEYRDRDFDAAESDLRNRWKEQHSHKPWDEVHHMVREGYMRIRERLLQAKSERK
ncbi:MAG TPA: glycine zipper domain-containing protein [Acidobacteriota bacterium]|nr:glycine zipper domain-containing protein [Acidobacteriota bacterium]